MFGSFNLVLVTLISSNLSGRHSAGTALHCRALVDLFGAHIHSLGSLFPLKYRFWDITGIDVCAPPLSLRLSDRHLSASVLTQPKISLEIFSALNSKLNSKYCLSYGTNAVDFAGNPWLRQWLHESHWREFCHLLKPFIMPLRCMPSPHSHQT